MDVLKFDRGDLSKRLERLDEWKQVAFALSVCERLFANYLEFARETSWGSPQKIRECLDLAWCRLSDGTAPLRLAQAAESCENMAPDTENFRSKYTSAALDAALSTANLMRLLNSFNLEKVLDIAEAGYETAEMFTYTDAESASIITAEDEQLRLQHRIVQGELVRQQEDVELLAEISGVFAENENVLRSKWFNQKPLS